MVIYADGIGSPTPGPGAWGAVLTYGEHTRELYDAESETTDNRMQLLAAVRALECLTRPVSVQVWINSEYVSRGVIEWQRNALAISVKKPDRDVDLWLRLAAASERHDVAWTWVDENISSPGYVRAAELALKELEAAEAQSLDNKPDVDDDDADEDDSSFEGPSIDIALTQFLADRQEHCSPRTFKKYESVIRTLRWSINWYANKKISAISASEITDHLADFSYTLVHKEFATPNQLKTVKTVLPALLKWLQTQGHLGSITEKSGSEDMKVEIDELIEVRKFVDALSAHVEQETANVDVRALQVDEWVEDQYLQVGEITDDSITFVDWNWQPIVGPIAIPPEIAEMADCWNMLLTAVRIGDEWRLLRVTNGDR